MFKTLNKYNYLVPIYLFLHYIFGSGNEVKIKFSKPNYEIKKVFCYLFGIRAF